MKEDEIVEEMKDIAYRIRELALLNLNSNMPLDTENMYILQEAADNVISSIKKGE